MKLTTQSYRGIDSASIDITPGITLISGTNGAGKTSILEALAALLTGDALSTIGVKKNAAKVVRAGSDKSISILETAHGKQTLTYPAAKVESFGKTLQASQYATGQKSVVDLDVKDLARYFDTAPTEEDFRAAVAPLKLDADCPEIWSAVTDLWSRITANGWDTVHDQVKETGAQLKGQWRQITGEQWGSAKGESYKVALAVFNGTEVEITDEDLEEAITQAQANVETARKQVFLRDHKKEELEALAAQHDTLFEATERLVKRMLDAEQAAKAAAAAYDDAVGAAKTYETCPACKAELVVTGTTIAIAPKRKGKKQTTILPEPPTALWQAFNEAREIYRTHIAEVERASAAASTLAELANTPYIELAPAEEFVAVLQERRAALAKQSEADSIHATITTNIALQEILHIDGLRRLKLSSAIDALNKQLLSLSGPTWGKYVQVDDALSFWYDGRPYRLCSESEKFRIRVTVQVLLATMDHSDMVVIDAADILDKTGRRGLMNLLSSLSIPSVVAMTFSERDDAPDLAAFGMGSTVWIADNTATLIRAEAVAA